MPGPLSMTSPLIRAPVQRFVIPPQIVMRNPFSVNNERARRAQVAFNHRSSETPFSIGPSGAVRDANDVPSKSITWLRCTL